MPVKDAALLEHCKDRAHVLKEKRLSWEPEWRDLSRFVNPNRGQLFNKSGEQRNRGVQKNQSVLDPTALFALRTFVAGFEGGVSSPARPWFRFTVPNQEVAGLAAVRLWLDICADRMATVFNSGNVYSVLPMIYEELAQFGVGAAILENDFEDVVRLYQMTAGEFWLAIDNRGAVDTLKRDFMYSHRQIVQHWGEDAWPISTRKKGTNEYDHEIRIYHLLEPNVDFDADRLDAKGKKFRSCYWADGGNAGELIAVSGYSRWPVLAPRWKPLGNDAYSRGPGHDGLPDTKSLQVFTKRLHNTVDKHANPPMGAHVSLRGSANSVLPGAMNYFTTADKGSGMWPLYQTNPAAIDAVRNQIIDTRQTINRAFYADIFLMIDQMEGVQPRNQLEMHMRKEEKMMMLGPVLRSVHDELLQPLISGTFDRMFETRLFPPPPQELHGIPLNIELISVLAQAQKAAALGAIERTFAFAGSIAGARPDILDNLDADKALDIYADSVGAPAAIIVGDDQVKAIRAARAKQQADAQAAQRTQQLVEGAKTLSETEVGGGRNALQAVTGQ